MLDNLVCESQQLVLPRNYPLATAMAGINRMWPGWLDDVNQWLLSRGIDWSWESNFQIDQDSQDSAGFVRFKRAQDQFLFELTWSEYVDNSISG